MTGHKGPFTMRPALNDQTHIVDSMGRIIATCPTKCALDQLLALLNASPDDAGAVAWPPRDCVAALVDAAKHLLDDHDCDTDQHERFIDARREAERWLANPHSRPSVGETEDVVRRVALAINASIRQQFGGEQGVLQPGDWHAEGGVLDCEVLARAALAAAAGEGE